ncbi:uncharacterized protein BDCG_04503 [Blastomyces dermatitidis ER-3]|uniref:Uncharacterized protein n=1 Tax=Ajellomyces dermatitidis (strain ER-3 / ATCC MYA-2586) TaxID=559297 RepID=A0ABP2F0L0_AJEDR|nr:uncharacterized protein BDCG_04503 [Blastomyces dermatitidis ER-3]EEQ89383.2 hypothetical protein BDCG_04503 [Blastomyces dermatitidis ER-3]EQL30928.1 hypothetical protein BDFG_06685 [Blastomyces dermatitidis ATCC 26199]
MMTRSLPPLFVFWVIHYSIGHEEVVAIAERTNINLASLPQIEHVCSHNSPEMEKLTVPGSIAEEGRREWNGCQGFCLGKTRSMKNE